MKIRRMTLRLPANRAHQARAIAQAAVTAIAAGDQGSANRVRISVKDAPGEDAGRIGGRIADAVGRALRRPGGDR